jgi:Ser/Thr protein kinase RdoA (MazF antagonist)
MKPWISAALLTKHWGLHGVRVGRILQRQWRREVVEVDAEEGNFVYKIAGRWKGRSAVAKDTAVLEMLAARGYQQAPRLIRTGDGKRFVELGGRFVYLLARIEGQVATKSAAVYRALGRSAARLHLLEGFPYRTDLSPERVLREQRVIARAYPFRKELIRVLESLPDFSSLPQAVLHTDLAPANAIRTGAGGLVLIDWEDAGVGPAVIDLGGVLNELIDESCRYRADRVRAFFGAYTSVRAISRRERARIVDAALFYAVMYLRFGNDPNVRWQRILWMLAHRPVLERLLGDCARESG